MNEHEPEKGASANTSSVPAVVWPSCPAGTSSSTGAGSRDVVVHQLAVEAAEIGVWERDMHTNLVTLCAICARMLDLPFEQRTLSDDEWRRLIAPDDLASTEDAIRHAAQNNARFSREYPVALPSGRKAWLMVRGAVINDAAGHPRRVIGIVMDITDRKVVDDALRASEERFRMLSELSPDGILVLVDDTFVYANPSALRMMGVTDASAIIGRPPRDFVAPSDWAILKKRIVDVLAEGVQAKPYTWPARRPDGSVLYVQTMSGRTSWNGQPAVQVLVRDLTQKMANDEKLHVMNERLKLAVEGTGQGIWDWDVVNDINTVSEGLRNILGYMDGDALSSEANFRKLIHPEDRNARDAALQAALAGTSSRYECEWRMRCADASWKWVISRGVVVARDDDGHPLAMTGIMTDVSARKETEHAVWQHANLDPLTGLPNRRHFMNEAESVLQLARRTGNKAALLFIDLDGFKQVNDIFGHDTGDRVLVEAARRIRQSARATDLIGRLGGDEFTVLLRDLNDPMHVEFVCQAVLASLAEPFLSNGETTHMSASIGVALYPLDAQHMEDLLRKSDQAMYNAKATGKNQFSYFTQEMDDRAHARLRVSTELRRAISAGQLYLAFQPVVSMSDNGIAKVEALLRWKHPKLGNVAPAVFVPIAEEAGLMGEIGNWVFHEAALHSKRWSERTGRPVQVAINKSPSQFSRRYMEHDWLQFLADSEIPAASIVVEITEGMLLDASAQVSDKLLEYRDAGIELAIDDFGTGYSSMAYLQKFDIDYLKIDQSFVKDIPAHKGNATIAETIIVMAHKLGLKVIAEGIETQQQRDFLAAAGCDFGQGFFYAPPLTPDRIERMLPRATAG